MDLVAWVTAACNLTVTGVRTKQASPPTQVTTATVPILFPLLPTIGSDTITVDYGGGLTNARLNLVIAMEPQGQNTGSTVYLAALTMVESLNTALDAARSSLYLDSYTIRVDRLGAEGAQYTAVIATLEASWD